MKVRIFMAKKMVMEMNGRRRRVSVYGFTLFCIEVLGSRESAEISSRSSKIMVSMKLAFFDV